MGRMTTLIVVSALTTSLIVSGNAFAEGTLEGEITATSQYLWRGVQLTEDAALQANLDFTDSTGIHANFFTSSVYRGTELQAAAGYTSATQSFDYDIGGRLYYLPQYDSSNFVELYAAIKIDNIGAKISLSPDAGTYIEGFFVTQVMERWVLTLHAGRFAVDDDDGGATVPVEDYFDYHLALSTMVQDDFRLEFKFAGTTLDDGEAPMATDNFRTIVTVSKKFNPQ